MSGDSRAAIAELKRRNRAAGKRLSPLSSRPANTVANANAAHTVRTANTVKNAEGRAPLSRERRVRQFSMSAPAVRRAPTKPSGPPRTSYIEVGRHGQHLFDKKKTESASGKAAQKEMEEREKNQEKASSPKRRRSWCDDVKKADEMMPLETAASDHSEEDELLSLNGYFERTQWEKYISQKSLAVLEGNKLEEPYATDLWRQSVDVDKPRVGGYYACMRCKVPIVAPEYQIMHNVRGMAAFKCLNKKSTEVRIGGLGEKSGSSNALGSRRSSHLPFSLHVVCRCCGGFLGMLSPECSSSVSSAFIFVVNSCCLQFMEDKTTRCRLDGTYDAIDDAEGEVDVPGDGEIDFDDCDIFEM